MSVHGFAKSEMDNIGDNDLARLKEFAALLFTLDDEAIARALTNREFQQVDCDA